MKIQLAHTLLDIISVKNLASAWQEFIVGKKQKPDVQQFERKLMDRILTLQSDLVKGEYNHGGYESFYVNDPKRRHIHKASVRDRLVHHAVYRILYPFFERTFIADSYSCRPAKGTFKAMERFTTYARQVSHNHTRTVWVLKCDIRKFFASIDHEILMVMLQEHIPDQKIMNLLKNIIASFHTEGSPGQGLPLGNLTSQLFANIYLNQLDQWVKHTLKAKQYIRYADDFVFLSDDKKCLEDYQLQVQHFLQNWLKLSLHPDKVFIKTMASGVDFLGWVHFPDHKILRKNTERRVLNHIRESSTPETLQSYLGLLSHGNTVKVRQKLEMLYWLWQ